MPALVNSRVGSLPGTSGLEGTTVWPLEAKKSRKLWRMALLSMVLVWCRARTSDNKALYPLTFRPYRRRRQRKWATRRRARHLRAVAADGRADARAGDRRG